MKAEMVAPDACPEASDARPGPSKDVKLSKFHDKCFKFERF